MSSAPASLPEAVRAFQDATATAGDGSVSRARVLARGAARLGRARRWRRALTLLPGLLLFFSVGAAAWTVAVVVRGRAPAAVGLGGPDEPSPSRAGSDVGARPRRVIPRIASAIVPAVASDLDPWLAESRIYGRAHEAHFAAGDPARALARWNDYLRQYPRGAFAPEARFNRALCLIRLDRFAEAASALGAVARDPTPASAYHRGDACALLRWMARGPAPREGERPLRGCD